MAKKDLDIEEMAPEDKDIQDIDLGDDRSPSSLPEGVEEVDPNSTESQPVLPLSQQDQDSALISRMSGLTKQAKAAKDSADAITKAMKAPAKQDTSTDNEDEEDSLTNELRNKIANADLSGKNPPQNPPIGQGSPQPLSPDDELKAAQEQARKDAGFAMLTRGLGQFAAGATRGNNYDDTMARAMEAQAGQGVQNILTRRKADKEQFDFENEKRLADPNSPESKLVIQMAKQAGINVPEGVSALKLKNLGINPTSLYDAYQNRLKRQEVAKTREQDRLAEAARKSSDRQNTEADKADALIFQSRGAMNQMKMDLYNVGKVEPLLNKIGTSPQERTLIGIELGKIAGGGVPQKEELQALNKQTLESKFGDLKTLFTGKPSEQDMSEFLSRYKSYIADLKSNAINGIEEFRNQVLDSKRRSMGEDNYQVRKEQIDKFLGKYAPNAKKDSRSPQSTLSPAQDKAVEAFMKGNGIKDKDKAIEILKQAGKL